LEFGDGGVLIFGEDGFAFSVFGGVGKEGALLHASIENEIL
jgi:hypothetical protein